MGRVRAQQLHRKLNRLDFSQFKKFRNSKGYVRFSKHHSSLNMHHAKGKLQRFVFRLRSHASTIIFPLVMGQGLCPRFGGTDLLFAVCGTKRRLTNIIFFCLSFSFKISGLIAPKSRYTIGGWIPGTNATFLKAWTPIFADYLTQEVGSQYSPPVKFEVIPVDYDAENSSPALARAGKLDFICKSQQRIAE